MGIDHRIGLPVGPRASSAHERPTTEGALPQEVVKTLVVGHKFLVHRNNTVDGPGEAGSG